MHGVVGKTGEPGASEYQQAERNLLRQAQLDSFPPEYDVLKTGKPIPSSSRLLKLSPELDETIELIHVGEQLSRATHLSYNTVHPIVLDPKYPITHLLIKKYNTKLCHPGPERVFTEIRIRIRIRMSFIAKYVCTYEKFVFMTEATAAQQNDSDRTKKHR